MPEAEVVGPTPDKVEVVVDNVINQVRSGDPETTLGNLWSQHQNDIVHAGKVLLLILLTLLLAWLISRICRKLILASTGKIPALDESVGKILSNIVKVLIWLLAALIVLDLLGVNTASILTVLGAAGLAVGLAMKDSLSNIAAGLMLLFMRPYKVGDYVDCGSVSGTIAEMGLFSTVLKTVDGLFISAPNSTIFGSPIKNYSRNPFRRADISVGIAYGDSLPKALEVLKTLLTANAQILQNPAPEVLVSELADSSVNLTLRFWAKTEDYWGVYWTVKRQLKETLESAGLHIPFPQRVITVNPGSGRVLEDK